MKVLKVVGLVFGFIALVAFAGAVYWFTAKPWIPKLELAAPVEGAIRVETGVLYANYFPTKSGDKRPALIVIGGSEGGISEGISKFAEEMSKENYNVLNVAFYRAPNQTKQLIEVPLEIFDKAVEYLKTQPNVDADKIGVIGASKGGEATLLVAARRPEIKVAVAGMPSNVVWAGIDWEHLFGGSEPKSSWSSVSKPLPYLPYGQYDNKTGTFSLYANGLKALSKYQNAIIPIEKSKAKILLICGEQDTLWPSCEMSRQVEARAKAMNGPQVTILAYPNAGHAVFGMPVDRSKEKGSQLASMGGTYDGNASAREDALPKIKAFLAEGFK